MQLRKLLLCLISAFLFIALWVPQAQAQGNYTAASCNYSDVNAVINGPTHVAVSGDTINIPGGSCTWSSNLPVSVGITLAGPGASSLTILDGYSTSSSALISVSLPSGQTFRITGFTLNPASGVVTQTVIGVTGTCNATSCPNLIVDHMTTSGFTFSSLTSTFIGTDNVFGVIYQNNFTIDFQTTIKVGHSAYLGVGTYGDNSWAQTEAYGTANALYIEDNTFINPDTAAIANVMDCSPNGCRYVFRFNTVTNGNVGGHGTDSTLRPRSMRMMDINNNQFIDDVSKRITWPLVVQYRGGTGVDWGNALSEINGTANPGFTGFIALVTYRRTYAFTPWGGCNGAGPYDQNDGTVYDSGTATATSTTLTDSTKNWTVNQWVQSGAPYSVRDTTQNFGSEIIANTATTASVLLTGGSYGQNNQFASGDSYQIVRATVCIDQPGRGAGTLLSGSTPSPTGWVNEALSPIYEWMDATGSYVGSATPIGSNDLGVLVNRDFYYESFNQAAQTSATSPFNGTSGNGHGTLALRPTTCTTGVGYFATNQGSWNAGTNPFYTGQGELFLCMATNTWTLIYTPYTYPHPLRAVVSITGALTFGSVTVNVQSSSQTATLTNNSGSTITFASGFITFSSTGTGTGTNFLNTSSGGEICAVGTLANGSSCTISVAFLPTTTGALSDTLNVAYTGASGSPQTVGLSGTGILGATNGAPTQKSMIGYLVPFDNQKWFCFPEGGMATCILCGKTECL